MAKNRNRLSLIVAIMLGMVLSTSVVAQSMFRCGNVYQDHPCEGGQTGKVVGNTQTAKPSSGSMIDVQCSQRGAAAQKIVWQREAGAMADQLLAKAAGADEKKLIADVYRRRGTSSEVRASIESDCVVAQEKAARTAALLDAIRQDQPLSEPVSGKSVTGEGNDKLSPATKNGVAENKRRCESLKDDVKDIINKQRSGGSAAKMDSLNKQKLDAESKVVRAGC